MSDIVIENQNSFISYIYWCCTVYVSLKIIHKLWIIIDLYVLPNYREPKDFKSYGQWAVITGSTDGIGKGFAEQLAAKGVDICLISRNEQKLQDTAKEIEKRFKVNTKCIVADFTDPNVYTQIRNHLEGLNIGILVNNVGILNERHKSFGSQQEAALKDYINVNILSAVMMTSIVLPLMIPKKRGLIINISSIAGEIVAPIIPIYSGTKTFMTKFSECLGYELGRHNIEMRTLTPGYVQTNMTRGGAKVERLSVISPTVDTFVSSALLTLNSYNTKGCGYFPHELLLTLTKLVPNAVVQLFFKYNYKKKAH